MPIRKKAFEYSKLFSFETDTLTKNKAVKRDGKTVLTATRFYISSRSVFQKTNPREVLRNSCSYIIKIFP